MVNQGGAEWRRENSGKYPFALQTSLYLLIMGKNIFGILEKQFLKIKNRVQRARFWNNPWKEIKLPLPPQGAKVELPPIINLF